MNDVVINSYEFDKRKWKMYRCCMLYRVRRSKICAQSMRLLLLLSATHWQVLAITVYFIHRMSNAV